MRKEDKMCERMNTIKAIIKQMCDSHQEPELFDELVSWILELQSVSWADVEFRYALLQIPEEGTLSGYLPTIKEQYNQVMSRMAKINEQLGVRYN